MSEKNNDLGLLSSLAKELAIQMEINIPPEQMLLAVWSNAIAALAAARLTLNLAGCPSPSVVSSVLRKARVELNQQNRGLLGSPAKKKQRIHPRNIYWKFSENSSVIVVPLEYIGGLGENRTRVQGFAVLCVTTPPPGRREARSLNAA
jgi:hypothetical protein